jgi:hypothetical protein
MRVLLLFLVIALSGLLYLQLEVWPQAAPGRLPVQPAAPAKAPPAASETAFTIPLGHASEYQVIAERTLFRPERRPAEEVQVEAEVTSSTQPLDGVDLRTVLITPDMSIAWVREKGGKEDVPLKVGEPFKGWKVLRIERDSLVLINGEQESSIALREFPEHAAIPPPGAKPGKAKQQAQTQLPQASARKQIERRRPPSRRPGREGRDQ